MTRDIVIATAVSIVDENGIDKLTLGAIAATLGVSVPSLYKHVAGLTEVRHGVALVAAGRLGAELVGPTVGRAGRDALVAMAKAYREWASVNPGQYQAIQTAPDPAETELIAAATALVTTIASVLAGYGLSRSDEIDAIRFVRSVLHGFVLLVAAGGFKLEQDLEVSFERMIDGLDLT